MLWWAISSLGSFLLGTIAGTIGGIIGERLWRKVESRPQLSIECGFHHSDKGEHGLTFTVTNCGLEPLPPFKLGIFTKTGTWYLFPKAPPTLHKPDLGPLLLPDQQEDFVSQWLTNGSLSYILASLATAPLSPETSFRVVMEKSEKKVLFESRRMGRALLAVAHRVAQDRSFEGISPGTTPEMDDLRAEPQGSLPWIWDKLRRRQVPLSEA